MTFREKIAQEHPEEIDDCYTGGVCRCPHDYGYEAWHPCECPDGAQDKCCRECWDREMPEEKTEETPSYVTAVVPRPSDKPLTVNCKVTPEDEKKVLDEMNDKITKSLGVEECFIRDSGDRTQFPSGAVRDMREGKGRCDLLPLDVVAKLYLSNNLTFSILDRISEFQRKNNVNLLYETVLIFTVEALNVPIETMLLEVAKHFEEGAKKYGDNNWQKGIPVRCYIDSAVRHYLKYLRGDKDEPHDRAFCWNILCAIWTCKHIPELNDYAKKEEEKC